MAAVLEKPSGRWTYEEYWIGDPANKSMEILRLQGGRFALHRCTEEAGQLTSALLPGLEFDLSDLQ